MLVGLCYIYAINLTYNFAERKVLNMNNLENVKVIREKRVVTLQSAQYYDLEKMTVTMKQKGWEVERFPQFRHGARVWEVSLSLFAV